MTRKPKILVPAHAVRERQVPILPRLLGHDSLVPAGRRTHPGPLRCLLRRSRVGIGMRVGLGWWFLGFLGEEPGGEGNAQARVVRRNHKSFSTFFSRLSAFSSCYLSPAPLQSKCLGLPRTFISKPGGVPAILWMGISFPPNWQMTILGPHFSTQTWPSLSPTARLNQTNRLSSPASTAACSESASRSSPPLPPFPPASLFPIITKSWVRGNC